MSRHNVTYKPGGAIGKPLEMTLKMQRVTPAAPSVPAIECPECPVVLSDLVAVWLGGDSTPISGSNIDVAVSSTSAWCESSMYCYTERTGSFLHVARMVNFDYATTGLAVPMNIDESACSWDLSWDGQFSPPPPIIMSGSTLAVGYEEGLGSGTLIITPGYNGVAMPVLTLIVAATISSGCV